MLAFSCRDQPGDGGEPGGHRQHAAGPPDAEILEGEAPGPEETGEAKTRTSHMFLFNSNQLITARISS